MTITTVDTQHRPGRIATIGAAAAVIGLVAVGVVVRQDADPSPEHRPSAYPDSRTYVAEVTAASPLELAAAYGDIGAYNPFATSTPEELAAAYGDIEAYNPFATSTPEELAAAYGDIEAYNSFRHHAGRHLGAGNRTLSAARDHHSPTARDRAAGSIGR